MKKALVPIVIIVALLVMIGGCGVGNYNRLVSKQTEVKTQFAQVDNQLTRRNDLIPNLVETVKGIASQERAVFGAIAAARAQMAGAKTPADKIAAGSAMDGALGRLLVVVENYPQLKSAENFQSLQFELAGTENRLAQERRTYNQVVGEYNVMVRKFPGMIYARLFGFNAEPFYPTTEAQRQVPKVNFGGTNSGTPADTTH